MILMISALLSFALTAFHLLPFPSVCNIELK
nr:MAG TPA: peptidase [Caudoviricetes sp.]